MGSARGAAGSRTSGSDSISSRAMAGLAAMVAMRHLWRLFTVAFAYLLRRRDRLALLVTFVVDLHGLSTPFVMARPHVLAWPLLADGRHPAPRSRRRPPTSVGRSDRADLRLGEHPRQLSSRASSSRPAVALDACMDSGWSRPVVLRWIALVVASLVASLLNVNGLPVFLHPFSDLGDRVASCDRRVAGRAVRGHAGFYGILLPSARHLLKRPQFRIGEVLAAGRDLRPGFHAHSAPVGRS